MEYIILMFVWKKTDKDVETYNVSNVPAEVLDMVEADTFWCMSKLLDGIQDNYTFAQPGIQMKVSKLQNLITRIDGKSMSPREHKGSRFCSCHCLQKKDEWKPTLR